jgi:similar to stage IV sporulation protein
LGFQQFVSFLTGYVEILARGPQLEKLINLITNSNFYLWDVKRLGPEVLQAKIRAHTFLRIREFIRKSGSTVRIHRKRGWPFLRRKLGRRKVFFIAAILFIAFLIYLSSFIFFIKVEGFKGEDQQRLLDSLGKAGLRPGILRKDLLHKKNFIEREVIRVTPRAVWLGINVRGVVAEIKVVQRKFPPAPQGVCDIVAARDGVITKMIVVRGVPVVKEGETVARGDLLISGTQWRTDPQTGELIKEELPASGMVEARVWNDLEALEPKIIWKPIPQNIRYTEYKLRWGRNLWRLAGFGKKEAVGCSLTRFRKRVYQGRNILDIVELIKDVWQKTSWRRVERLASEIKAAALLEIDRKKKLLAVSQSEQQIETWSNEGSFVKLSVNFESTQEISTIAFRGKGYH